MHGSKFTRRALIGGGLTLAGDLAFTGAGRAAASANDFSFVHITDTHIQPELGATQGVAKAFSAIRALKERPDFALVGGDLVMDALAVDRKRADLVYDLWLQAASNLNLPAHYSIGNHDIYDLNDKHTLGSGDTDQGKKLWMRRLNLASTYSAFTHKNWLFITLDSIQLTNDGWKGGLDKPQMDWLDGVLRKTDKKTPIVFLTHIPILTIFGQYTQGTTAALSPASIVENGKPFQEMIQPYNVKAVFQGHTHVVEECAYLGTHYITGGAVCGDWWKGKRLGVHDEGFVAATVKNGELSWKYVPYGWKPVAV